MTTTPKPLSSAEEEMNSLIKYIFMSGYDEISWYQVEAEAKRRFQRLMDKREIEAIKFSWNAITDNIPTVPVQLYAVLHNRIAELEQQLKELEQ